jgi:hypothetical protein
LFFVSHTRAMIGKSGIGIIPLIWTFVVPFAASGVIPAARHAAGSRAAAGPRIGG